MSLSARRPVVVYIGIEPAQLPPSFAPDRRLQIEAGIEAAMRELQARHDARWCGVGMDPAAAVATVRAALDGAAVDCVLIGAGLRITDAALVLFEAIVNEVHRRCPQAALCFNSTPADSAAAVERGLAARSPSAQGALGA